MDPNNSLQPQQPFHKPGEQFAPTPPTSVDTPPHPVIPSSVALAPASSTPQPTATPQLPVAPLHQPAAAAVSIPPIALNQTAAEPAGPVVGIATDGGFSATQPIGGTAAVVNGQAFSAAPVSVAARRARPRKKFLFGGLTAAIVLLFGGVAFGWYIPNRPGNVWKTGVDHTGQAIDGVVQAATTPDKLQALGKSQIDGTFKASSDSFGSVSGKLSSWQSSTDSDSGLTVDYTGQDKVAHDVDVSLLTSVPAGKQLPDVYLKANGLSGLGLDAFVPNISSYDNKWLFASSDYLKSLAGAEAPAANSSSSISPADAAALVRSLSATTKQYVFSNDPEKAVLKEVKFVGKEKVDGVKTNHYTVGYNKANIKKYCSAIGDTLANSAAYKKVVGSSDQSKRKTNYVTACQQSADGLRASDTFDAWVGGRYRLIQKVRFYANDKKSYVDVGEHYNGGDAFDLYADFHSDGNKNNVKLNFSLNSKTSRGSGSLTGSGDGYSFSANFSLQPYTGKATITRPTDAISVQDLLAQLQSQAAAQQDAAQNQAAQVQAAANSAGTNGSDTSFSE